MDSGAGQTVTVREADLPLKVFALIFALPTPTARTVRPSMRATFSLELVRFFA